MLRKNSIFIRVLLPVTIVMLIQSFIISMVLFANGTIASLENNAIESLRKNVENRRNTLEDFMVHNLSNLDKLESDIVVEIDDFLKTNNLTIDDVLGDYQHETSLLFGASDSLIDALRRTSSTGVFMYFIDGKDHSETTKRYNGLYYRDPDPVTTPADNSDILFLRGFVDTARKDQIQLDILWSEAFVLSPDNTGVWNGYYMPLLASSKYNGLSIANRSYWSAPHLLNPDSPIDSDECITYTRPLFWNGRPVAIIGTEFQVNQLKKYYPANDFESSDKGGYMLLKYDLSKNTSQNDIVSEVYAVNGSYIKRLLNNKSTIRLTRDRGDDIYVLADIEGEAVHLSLQPLKLYNSGAPFANEQWALASAVADSTLFEPSSHVSSGILYGASVALVAGILMLAFIIRLITRPIISIVEQIEVSDPDDPIVVSKSTTYETALLCDTINTMKEKRRLIEAELREERERYLVALESAADTFLEYDIAEDSFMLYYFSADNQKPQLYSRVTRLFLEKVRDGTICHIDDSEVFIGFLCARDPGPIEVRVKPGLFSHVTGERDDCGYFWVLFRASHIPDEDGRTRKIIGTARLITEEKLKQITLLEASRHDPVTGLYNRDYGLGFIEKSLTALIRSADRRFAVCVIHIDGFDTLEAHYGRVFGGIVLMRLCTAAFSVLGDDDIAVRLNNNELLFFMPDAGREELERVAGLMRRNVNRIYMGEDPGLRPVLRFGAALSSDYEPFGALFSVIFQQALRAALYALCSQSPEIEYFGQLPPAALCESTVHRDTPVSVSLDISREGIVGLVFELFEHTTDIKSVINLLLEMLGDMFSLRQIIIRSYDDDFSADQVIYQWNGEGQSPHHLNIEQVMRQDMDALERMLDENGSLALEPAGFAELDDGVKRLLCLACGEYGCVLCCGMYESGVHAGRILFKTSDGSRQWSDSDIHDLHEITKIISAHISIDKSNSASRAKSEFLSRVSHEIRTPMNAIIGMTGIAMENIENPKRLEECLSKIGFSAQHLLAVINDVLDMSRIESGKLKIGSDPFSLSAFISTLDMLMRTQFERKGIAFTVRHECSHDTVIGDEYRIRQVMVNFLGNASKFTDSGGAVTLEVCETESSGDGYGSFKFSVRDTGIGIDKEEQQQVFRAFEQASAGKHTHRQREGTGLGLSISSSIVSAMGSKIELVSEPDMGSEFFFVLKLKLEDDTLSPAEQSDNDDYKKYFEGKTILLVEDNELNIEIAEHILTSEGLGVEIARNGQEALDKFSHSEYGYYAAILMDIQMPVMDGLTATREIRKNRSRPDAQTVPIIAMTADAFDEDMKKSIESGMNGHIAKPVDNQKLYSVLKQLLQRD